MPYVGIGSLFGSLDEVQQEEVLKRVGEEAKIRFNLYKDILLNSIGMLDLKGEDALNFYRARTPEDWTALEQLDEKRYKEQLRQWAELQKSSEARLQKMIEEVAPSSVKSLARGRVTEKQATAKVQQASIRPQF